MEVQEDFREFLALLNEHEVEFMIVGGCALAFHGATRFTGDIHVFVKPDHQNARQIIKALEEFGFSSLDLTIDDFKDPDKVIQLGLPPVRIDIITSISGVSWEETYASKVPGLYGDVSVSFIGNKQFITSQRPIGRKKDLAHIEALGEE
jgi:hypothetical protein